MGHDQRFGMGWGFVFVGLYLEALGLMSLVYVHIFLVSMSNRISRQVQNLGCRAQRVPISRTSLGLLRAQKRYVPEVSYVRVTSSACAALVTSEGLWLARLEGRLNVVRAPSAEPSRILSVETANQH